MDKVMRDNRLLTRRERVWQFSRTRRLLYWLTWALPIIVGWCSFLAWFDARYTIALNRSSSLEGSLYLIRRDGKIPEKGALVAVRPGPTPVYEWDVTYIKVLGGVPGDWVEEKHRNFFVNGEKLATAKQTSRLGIPMALGPVGVIPKGHYFMYTPSEDGYDSRYLDIGWLPAETVVGEAYVLL